MLKRLKELTSGEIADAMEKNKNLESDYWLFVHETAIDIIDEILMPYGVEIEYSVGYGDYIIADFSVTKEQAASILLDYLCMNLDDRLADKFDYVGIDTFRQYAKDIAQIDECYIMPLVEFNSTLDSCIDSILIDTQDLYCAPYDAEAMEVYTDSTYDAPDSIYIDTETATIYDLSKCKL